MFFTVIEYFMYSSPTFGVKYSITLYILYTIQGTISI